MYFSSFELPYLVNSTNLLLSLQKLGGLVALESSNNQHPEGRWSIISAAPVNSLELHDSHKIDHFLKEIEALDSKLSPIDSPLPFTGGIIGHASYDLGIPNNKPNPHYRVESQPLCICGLYSWAFLIDHTEQKSHLVYWSNISTIDKESLCALFNESLHKDLIKDNFQISQPFSGHWNKDTYKEKISKIKEYILSGDTYQVNLAQKFSTRYKGNPLQGFIQLKEKAKVPFATYFETRNFSFASASPELFLNFENNCVTTKPIKGTLPRLINPTEDRKQISILKNSQKDLAENLMIVDLLRNDLGKHAKNIKTTKLFEVETFETVHHLVSTIEGTTNKQSMLKLFFDAFPGGSITGAPKKRSMEIISELEKSPRSFYCGSSFYLSSNQRFNSNILIRSFLFEEGNVTCWAGGGIVHDSNWQSEYQESLDKISKLMEALY